MTVLWLSPGPCEKEKGGDLVVCPPPLLTPLICQWTGGWNCGLRKNFSGVKETSPSWRGRYLRGVILKLCLAITQCIYYLVSCLSIQVSPELGHASRMKTLAAPQVVLIFHPCSFPQDFRQISSQNYCPIGNSHHWDTSVFDPNDLRPRDGCVHSQTAVASHFERAISYSLHKL